MISVSFVFQRMQSRLVDVCLCLVDYCVIIDVFLCLVGYCLLQAALLHAEVCVFLSGRRAQEIAPE